LYHYPTIIGICADYAYHKYFKNIVEEFYNIKVDISKRLDSTFKVMPKRWKVERTLSWFNNSRRLSKDYEIKTFYQENICIISNLSTLLKRFQVMKTDS
jgi:transposase